MKFVGVRLLEIGRILSEAGVSKREALKGLDRAIKIFIPFCETLQRKEDA